MQTNYHPCEGVKCWLCHEVIKGNQYAVENWKNQNHVVVVLISHIKCTLDLYQDSELENV